MSTVYFDERAFADKVMARVAVEPTPTIAAASRQAVRQMRPSLLVGTAWTAWHLATSRTAVVRPPLRIKSAALLSVMLLMVAMGTTLACAGAVAVVEQVTHNFSFPSLNEPHKPGSSGHGGGLVPSATQDPGADSGDHPDPTTAPATHPPLGSPAPTGGATGEQPTFDPGISPTPKPTHDGRDQGNPGKNGGGNDNGGGKGTQTSPTPTDGGQGTGNDGGNGNTGNGNATDGSGDQPTPTPTSGTDTGTGKGQGPNRNGGDTPHGSNNGRQNAD